jgi:carotenoid cleavage dioxygenase-like enzyme
MITINFIIIKKRGRGVKAGFIYHYGQSYDNSFESIILHICGYKQYWIQVMKIKLL